MRNEDNACIRYLMKEMDPSEEVLMERAMMEDEDLLIEVECMRQTLKRLDDLPCYEPPRHVSESIVEEAITHRNELNSNWFSGTLVKTVAAAAVIVVGLLFGGSYWLLEGYGLETGVQSQADRATSNSASVSSSPAMDISNVRGNNLEPWIDQNDIIHFQDRFNNKKMEFDSILKTSTQKLTPLKDPFQFNQGSRSLQLTGGGE